MLGNNITLHKELVSKLTAYSEGLALIEVALNALIEDDTNVVKNALDNIKYCGVSYEEWETISKLLVMK